MPRNALAIPDPPVVGRFAAIASLPLAGLVAIAALGGILLPSVYAKESATWSAQGYGQDWVDLVVVAPALAVAAVAALRGSRRAAFVLGGCLVYTLYSFVLYAFAVHFNVLFLVYCAVLGLSFYALASLARSWAGVDGRAFFDAGAPTKLAGIAQIVSAVAFAALWLAEDVPALVRGVVPPSVAEAELFTNPVHVLDLSLLLPAFAIGGVSLLRKRSLGYLLGPIMLAFGVLMTIAIAGMFVAMRLRQVPVDLGVAGAMGVNALVVGAILAALLRHVRDGAPEVANGRLAEAASPA